MIQILKIQYIYRSNMKFNRTLDLAKFKLNKVHQKDNISRILWFSDWLHNTTSAGNSIFVTNRNTTSCGKKYYATYQTTIEYEK